jgi:TonB family protein
MQTYRMLPMLCCLVVIVLAGEREADSQSARQDRQPSEAALLSRIAAQPDDPTSYLDLAKLYYREERYQHAADAADRASRIIARAQLTRVPRLRESILVNAPVATLGKPLQTPPITPPAIAATGMIEPRKIHHVMPIYPESARLGGVMGIVVIDAIIDRHGNVTDARVIQSVPLLDDAALTAVQQWKYRPTRVDGAAVPSATTITVTFGLK